MKKVFINGYGSIGKRIAKFILDDPELQLIGIGKHTPDNTINKILSKGLKIYVLQKKLDKFKDYKISGSIENAIEECDLVIDASPSGCGFYNKKSIYDKKNVMVIYQGGETIFGNNAISDLIFNSTVNYDQVKDKKHVIQGSCNVTGMGRILNPLVTKYGKDLLRFDLTLIRRWADLEDDKTIVKDSVELVNNPHHANDVTSYLGKKIPIFVRAIKVPTRQMHVHFLDVRFHHKVPDISEILSLFKNKYGIAILETAKNTKEIRDFAQSTKFNFKDTNMIHIYSMFVEKTGDTIKICYSDDQTGIVIPENHLLLQAMLFKRNYDDAIQHTEKIFHMEQKKKLLEMHFANYT